MKNALEVRIFYLLINQLNHSRKHPVTLYECDCGEIILRSEVQTLERGEGFIECNKAGCETLGKWHKSSVSVLKMRWTHHPLQFHMECVRLEFSVQNWVCESCVASDSHRKQQKRWNRPKDGPNDLIYPYLEIYSHNQLVSRVLKRNFDVICLIFFLSPPWSSTPLFSKFQALPHAFIHFQFLSTVLRFKYTTTHF